MKINLENKTIQVKFAIDSNNFIDNENLYIAIDGDLDIHEVIKLYEECGEKFIFGLKGFFSIYVYDKKQNTVLLVRDPVGSKHIYYHIFNGSIYCGNDLMKLINTYSLEKEINTDALSMYFRYHYINPPQTIFKDIYKLKHGHYLIFKDNEIQEKIYWSVFDKYNTNSKRLEKDFNAIKETLNEQLCLFVEDIVCKEENYGVYLSGGIDSSLVTAISTKYANKKINTYSIGFYDPKFNEAEKSKRIAEYLGTNHHELYINTEKLLETIKKIPQYYAEPFADPSELPTIVLNEFAKENNIKIALTGDGADQLFCGSNDYDLIRKCDFLQKIFNPLNIHISPKVIKKRKLFYTFCNNDKRHKSQCDVLFFETALEGLFKDNGQKRYEEQGINTKKTQEKRMILDFDTYYCSRVSTKMVTAANKNNIEIRSPFLNTDLIEYSFRIPHKYKYYKKIKKYILKEILFDYIPEELFSKKKQGFGIPVKKWLKTYLYKDLSRVASYEFIDSQKIFNYEKIQELIKDIDNYRITQILWDFYMFQLWYEKYFKKN